MYSNSMIIRKITPYLEKELETDNVIVLTGMRRAGKTTLILYLYDKIKDRRKLYLDLENPLNQSYFSPVDYDEVKVYLEQLAQGKGKKLVVFLDEIQNVKNLPSIVKYLYDHYKIKFVLTGSASFYLKNLFAESLSGRKRIFELSPLDFEEFLSYKAPHIKKPALKDKVTKPVFDLFDKYVFEYLSFGGFPSVVLKQSGQEKVAEIRDIFTSYYQNEIRLLSDFRKLAAMRETITLLTGRVGSKIDISKMSSELGISRITIGEYLDFLEGTYLIKRIKPYSQKIDVTLRGQAKPYFCDIGFLTMQERVADSVVLENAVYNLIRNHGEVFFYQSKSGSEIDFILKKGIGLLAFEVKSKAHITDVNRLKRLAGRFGVKDYYVVSRNYSPLQRVIYPFQL